jgi:hypothetical protein
MVEQTQKSNPMFVPSFPYFRDMLRTVVTGDNRFAVLICPAESGYFCRGGRLYKDGRALSDDELYQLVKANGDLRDPLMVYGLFSFFYFKGDIRNRTFEDCRITDLYEFLEISKGGKGYPLRETLESFESVFGWVLGKGVFPLLQIEPLSDGRLRLSSEYFHHALNALIAECHQLSETGFKFRLTSVPLAFLRQRNKQAALIAMEFAFLLETMSSDKDVREISLETLMKRVPAFGRALRDESKPVSYRNRYLRETLKRAKFLVTEVSDLPSRYPNLTIVWEKKLSVKNERSRIMLWRKPPVTKKGESK